MIASAVDGNKLEMANRRMLHGILLPQFELSFIRLAIDRYINDELAVTTCSSISCASNQIYSVHFASLLSGHQFKYFDLMGHSIVVLCRACRQEEPLPLVC